MRTGRIARAGQAGSFRRCWFYRVKIGEQGLAAGLPRHSHKGDKIIGRCACDAAFGHTSIAVAIENPASVVHGDFVEIQQIAILVTATLLPNAGVTLNRVIWRSVDCCPRLTLIVSGGNEGIPFACETVCLVVTWLICGYEAASSSAGTPADCLGMRGVLDPMRCTHINVANPGLAAVRADFDMNVALRRTVRRHRLIVHITKISGVIVVNCDRRIGAITLDPTARDKKFSPCGAAIRANGAALHSSTVLDWQPRRAVRRHMHMAVQPAALRSYAIVSHHAGTITGAERVAALARCPHSVLRAIINRLAVVDVVYQHAQRSRIRSRTNAFVIDAAIWRRETSLDPTVAIIVAVGINSVRADCRIRCKSSARVLIGKEDRVQPYISRERGLVLPQRFATLRLSWIQALRWSEPPDRPDVHRHYSPAVRIEPNVELAIARFGRSARGRVEILIARNARYRRVRSAEA